MKNKKTWTFFIAAAFMTAMLSITALAGSWQRQSNGWMFLRSSGEYAKNIMLIIDDEWYAFDEYGYMVANRWVKADGDWHYCTGSGAVARNQWIDGKYYVGNDGVMLTNTWTPDGYYVNELGEWDPSKTKQGTSGDRFDGYYTIDGNWDNRTQSGFRDDYRVDLWIQLNPAEESLATMDFGLYTTTGTGYSLYDRSNPNGDSLNIATVDGIHWGGRSTIDDQWYDLTYDGKDTITLEWRRTTWTDGRLVFKRRDGGRRVDYWTDSSGGVG